MVVSVCVCFSLKFSFIVCILVPFFPLGPGSMEVEEEEATSRETVWRTGHSNKHSVLKTEASWRSLLRAGRGRRGHDCPSFQRNMSQK